MQDSKKLVTIDFIFICTVIFITYCNITVFYSLYVYLEELQIAKSWRGFIIGCSALSTIGLFLFASPYLTARTAVKSALIGACIMVFCGIGYVLSSSMTGLIALRLLNGTAIYLLSASCMTLMVSSIPTEKNAQAFSLYSVALLLPYSTVPAICDFVNQHASSVAYSYCGMSLLLIPAIAMIMVIGKRQRKSVPDSAAGKHVSFKDMYKNALTPKIALVLALNTLYIVTFSSLFFMAEGLFLSRGYDHVGSYFTIQMFCMIIIRLFGNQLFDKMKKIRLIALSFLLSAVSFLLAAHSYSLVGLYASSVVMGVAMGLSSPALYSLMYTLSSERFRVANSNLMILSLQIGNFLGPVYGAAVMHQIGYTGFLYATAGCCLFGEVLCLLLTSHKVDSTGLAARA